LRKEDIEISKRIIAHLLNLGYVPQRQKRQGLFLAFKNSKANQTIAKIGVNENEDKAIYSLKFYACKNPPPNYLSAIDSAIKTTGDQFQCCNCGVCGATEEERGYHCQFPNGKAFVRCGAYVIPVPCDSIEDGEVFKTLITEQHQYFIKRKGLD